MGEIFSSFSGYAEVCGTSTGRLKGVEVREAGRCGLEESPPMVAESGLLPAGKSSGRIRGVLPVAMDWLRECAWAAVGWAAGRAVLEVEISDAVGGALWWWESAWALLLRFATWRATVGDVGEVALLLSLLCELPIPAP